MFLQFFSLRLIVASIKLQIEVLEESKVMIPDCKRRIKTAYLDLQELVVIIIINNKFQNFHWMNHYQLLIVIHPMNILKLMLYSFYHTLCVVHEIINS